MSKDSSDNDGLADWALVSQEGSIEGDETSSGSCSDEFVNVTHDGVVFSRHRSSSPEAGPVSESLASSEMSALLQSSLDETEQEEATEVAGHASESELETGEHLPPSIPSTKPGSSLAGSMASTGDESTDIVTEDEVEDQHLEPLLNVELPPSIDIASSMSSLSLVPGLPVSIDAADTGADHGAETSDDCVEVSDNGAEASDDGIVSLSTDSLACSESERGDVRSPFKPRKSDEQAVVAQEDVDSESVQKLPEDAAAASDLPVLLKTREADKNMEEEVMEGQIVADGGVDADVGDEAVNVEGACGEGSQWLKYPIESSNDQCHTIRLGDGRVIVAPPGADLESLAASLHLANKSETSSETGSDSDFVRLEAISSCSSSNDNTDSEGEEVSREELLAPVVTDGATAAPVEDVMAESVSSVSSRFRFLPQQNNEDDQAPEPAPILPVVSRLVVDDNNDGDTESVGGHSEDDHIETDQSEANALQLAEEEDRALEDIGDIPLLAGYRQYVHLCNRHLNWNLDVVVIMVTILAIGMGIRHSIGSIRELAIQQKINVAQQNRMSLLHKDMLQLLERSNGLVQADSDRRREVEELTKINRELRRQLEALEDELTIKVTALSQCRQTAWDLHTVRNDLRNDVNQLLHENAELTSRIAAMQYQTILPEDGIKTEEIEELKKQADHLKIENANLKAEIAKMRFLLSHSSDSSTVDDEDDGYESMDDVSEVTSTSCPRTVEGHGKVTDLKSRINLLEQENADMRAEIGRLRYKSHPGNVQGGNQAEEKQHLTEGECWFNRPLEDDVETDEKKKEGSVEEILQLKSELYAAKRQAENWEKLYVALKEKDTYSKTKCNNSIDFFKCMKLFTQQINSSINATSIKGFLNVTKLLLSVEDVKDAFVNEFQSIWKEFLGTGSKDKKEEEKSQEGSPHAQKKWSDSVKDILNKTQSSMSDMSQQIKDTWNQVKNLSEELWKKHEPSLSRVASKITEKVKKFSDNVQNKIHQKASKWFKKQHKQWKQKDRSKQNMQNEKRKHSSGKWKHQRSGNKHHKGKPGKKHLWKPEKRHHKDRMEKNHHKEKKHEKSKWQHQRQEDRLRRKVEKHIQDLKDLMVEMSEEKHLTMTKDDVQEVCDFFIQFQSEWDDMFKLLKFTDVQWIICQTSWWHARLNDKIPLLGLKCMDKTYGWQLEWSPSVDGKGNFRAIRGNHFQLGKKLKKKILERNHAAGKPYSYENEKLMQDDDDAKNQTDWFEQFAKDREEFRKEWKEGDGKGLDGDKDWYESMMKSRLQQREEEHKSDWLFERAADREEGRSKEMNIPTHTFAKSVHLDSNGQTDPRAEWLFARAEEREYHNTQPDSWVYKRAEARQQSQDHVYSQSDEYDDDAEDGDDYDDYYDGFKNCEL